MAEKSGFLGWKVGEQPNVAAFYIEIICCGWIYLWNVHLILTEFENRLGMSSKLHWVKVILFWYGLLELEKEIKSIEVRNGIETKEGDLPMTLICTLSMIPCCVPICLLAPYKLGEILQRANEVFKKQNADA